MIEYKIKLHKIDKRTSSILVSLIPVDEEKASDQIRNIVIEPAKLQEILALSTSNEMLLALRSEIVKGNAAWQDAWAVEVLANSVEIPEELLARIGDEFPVVTSAEASAAAPAPISLSDEVVI